MYYDDSVIERSTTQMLLRHLLPLLCLLAMAGVLNLLNLGYADQTLGPALQLTPAQLAFADDLFCVGYLLASLPATWLLLRFGARIWLTGVVLASAGLTIGHALVGDATSLYAVRFLLGVAEAGLLPAMVLYIIQWMPERHRAKAIGPLIAAAAVVPIFAGLGSDFLLLLGAWFGISDWRFMFVVEGLPTLWLGLLVPGRVPQEPADVNWLPPSERLWLLEQLRPTVPLGVATRFTDGLRSPSVWKLAATQGITGLVGGSLGLWVPLAMQQSGYVPPVIGIVVMIIASAIGVAGAVAAGLVLHDRPQWRRTLVSSLALAGCCLGMAALLPFGVIAVFMLAIIAIIVPTIVALIWMLASGQSSGPAAAAGLAVLSMAGVLGFYAADWLAAVRSDAAGRCLILAIGCLVAAWLIRGLDGRHMANQTASAASLGE